MVGRFIKPFIISNMVITSTGFRTRNKCENMPTIVASTLAYERNIMLKMIGSIVVGNPPLNYLYILKVHLSYSFDGQSYSMGSFQLERGSWYPCRGQLK